MKKFEFIFQPASVFVNLVINCQISNTVHEDTVGTIFETHTHFINFQSNFTEKRMRFKSFAQENYVLGSAYTNLCFDRMLIFGINE